MNKLIEAAAALTAANKLNSDNAGIGAAASVASVIGAAASGNIVDSLAALAISLANQKREKILPDEDKTLIADNIDEAISYASKNALKIANRPVECSICNRLFKFDTINYYGTQFKELIGKIIISIDAPKYVCDICYIPEGAKYTTECGVPKTVAKTSILCEIGSIKFMGLNKDSILNKDNTTYVVLDMLESEVLKMYNNFVHLIVLNTKTNAIEPIYYWDMPKYKVFKKV